MLGLGSLTLTSCSDPMDEIANIVYGRVFSPVDLDAKNVTQNSANLQWMASEGASKYVVEVFADDSNMAFEGMPAQTYETTENNCNVTGLVYDTDYAVRVMAVDGEDESRNSKWSTVSFRTAAQQILLTPKETEIADRFVTMSWPAGEEVTRLVALDESGAEVVSKELTAEEIEAGRAKLEGLSPETKYTVKLYNGNKERGSKSVTTIIDLNGATTVSPDDNIQSVIENATDGQVFALYGGTYTVDGGENATAGSLKVSKNITIKGIYPTNVPTINGRIELQDGATLTINQVNFDGTGTSGDQFINVKGTSIGKVSVNNAEIKNYTKGVIYVNVAAAIPEVTFNNCLIHDIICEGGDMFDCRKGRMDVFNLTNSTIYASCAARDFIRIDDASGALGGSPVVNVNQCTIDAASNTSGKRLLYVRYVGSSINWTNNIVSNTAATWSNQSKTAVPTFRNNNYHNCAKLQVLDGSDAGKTNLFTDTASPASIDPQYKNAAAGDFTYGNEDIVKGGYGDKRWNP